MTATDAAPAPTPAPATVRAPTPTPTPTPTTYPAPAELRRQLIEAGLLVETGIDGLYGRSAAYESIVRSFDNLVSQWAATQRAQLVQFPPLMARTTFDQTNYLQSFPDLMGSVHIFKGDDKAHAQLVRKVEADDPTWPSLLEPAEVVLCSAACHSVYPICTGQLPPQGRRFEVNGWCFRHEPSIDPARQQAFRMHEVVYVGDPESAESHRDNGLAWGLSLLTSLGLEMHSELANDPFFGRLGTAMAVGQLDEGLKIEGVTPITSAERPTAIMSGNCHRDHFGAPFGITTASGDVAHSACVAFGVDRITLALLQTHGLEPEHWPSEVRARLES